MDEDTIDACCQVIRKRIDELIEAEPDANDEGWRGTLDYGIAQLEGVCWSIRQMRQTQKGPET